MKTAWKIKLISFTIACAFAALLVAIMVLGEKMTWPLIWIVTGYLALRFFRGAAILREREEKIFREANKKKKGTEQ